MFGTSSKTISPGVKSYNLREEVPKHDNISNDSLDSTVSAVLHDFPNCGIRRIKGFLLGRGSRVQWSSVTTSLWRIDPSGILLRTSQLNVICLSAPLQCSRTQVIMPFRWQPQVDQMGIRYSLMWGQILKTYYVFEMQYQ